ncbi:MAG: hypothetical protein ACPHRO_14810 [Nannocystaceae bacterium]
MLPAVETLVTTERIQSWIRTLAGGHFELQSGALHVVAVHADASGLSKVMKIEAQTPRSRGDRMCLELARRWADAVVLTGEILRSEPSLDYAWWGPTPIVERALQGWRAEVVGASEPSPWLVVMTRGRGLPHEHPLLAHPKLVLCVPEDAVVDGALSHVRVIRLPGGEGRGVLDVCRSALGVRRISVEAGPRSSSPLYESPCRVDVMLRSTYRGAVPPGLLAEAFVREERLADVGQFLARAQQVAGEDAEWTHELWRRDT